MPRKKIKRLIRRKVVVAHEPDGKPVEKWYSGYDEEELAASRAEVIKKYATGALEVQADMPYYSYVQQWYDVYKKGKLSDSSKDNYALAINNYIIPAIGDKQLRAISDMDLQELLNGMAGKGKTLIGDTYSILQNTFARATARRMIEFNPSLGLEKPLIETSSLRALTADETAAALKAMKSLPHPLNALLCLLYYTGMRRGEALGLQWQDIDFKKLELHVRRDVDPATDTIGTVKSKYSLRTIPMPQPLVDMLRPIRGLKDTHVIQSPRTGSFLGQSTYGRWFSNIQAEIYTASFVDGEPTIDFAETSASARRRKDEEKKPAEKRQAIEPVLGSILTAHYFRHNYATVLYYAGVSLIHAQKYLGHADPLTTLKIYTHLDELNSVREDDKVRAAFSGAGAV